MQADIRNKEKAARRLNKAVDEITAASGDQPVSSSPVEALKDEMNEKLRATQAKGREKENKLQESMRQVGYVNKLCAVQPLPIQDLFFSVVKVVVANDLQKLKSKVSTFLLKNFQKNV